MIAKSRQARRAGERQSRHRDSSVVDVQSQIWGSTDSPAWTPKSKTESLGVVQGTLSTLGVVAIKVFLGRDRRN